MRQAWGTGFCYTGLPGDAKVRDAAFPGRTVVKWLGGAALVLLLAFWWVFQRGLKMSASEQARSAELPASISTSTGAMRLVGAGKFMSGEDPVPVNLPAFYIDVDPVKTGLSFTEAKRTCAAVGQRLPSSIEFEKAFEQPPQVREWVDDTHQPRQFELRAFRGRLDPPASIEEAWSTVRGGPGAKRTDYTSAPVRHASPEIAFRCALTPR